MVGEASGAIRVVVEWVALAQRLQLAGGGDVATPHQNKTHTPPLITKNDSPKRERKDEFSPQGGADFKVK